MRRIHLGILSSGVVASLVLAGLTPQAESMCGYFRPIIVDVKQPSEVLQPSQIAFVTWDPKKKEETVTVQPRFEGNAADFAMVIPTPTQPKLDAMPRDFFKALGLFTTPKRRAFPVSKLVPQMNFGDGGMMLEKAAPGRAGGAGGPPQIAPEPKTTVAVLEVGQVGNLDYKIIAAGKSDDLYKWLKDNRYSYDGDEATLNYYVQKKYFFTVMKIDTLQMKRGKDGAFVGDVTPTRFKFASEELVYPTRITQVSVKDKSEALFYIQAPYKVDLPGDMTYQYQWVSALHQIQANMGPGELTQANRDWYKQIQPSVAGLQKQGTEKGFQFNLGQASQPNKQGQLPSTLEWAKKITKEDEQILAGTRPYSETVPDPDDGFTIADMRDPQRAAAIIKIIQQRLAKYQKEQPRGYLVRDAKKDDIKTLPILQGHIQPGQYLTKFHHTFTRAEMGDDLVLTQAKVGGVDDVSDHEEVLRMLAGGRPGGRGGPGAMPLPPNFKLELLQR
jgi:Uncharacterized protein conserved in bacteria (DUF2330)